LQGKRVREPSLSYRTRVRTLLVLIGNILRLALLPLWLLARRLRRPRGRWVEARLAADPSEIALASPRWRALLTRSAPPKLRSIAELRRVCGALASDPRMDGLLVYIPHLSCGWATCASLRQELAALASRGKRVVAYLPLGGADRELYVASAADRVLTSPPASISLLGVSSQPLYLKRVLDRLGLELEVEARKQWKTAAEPLQREEMSDAQREQLGAILGSIQGELERALAARPGLSLESVRALFERGVMGLRLAREAKLIDGTCYEDELQRELATAVPPLAARRYLRLRSARLWRPLRQAGYVAVVPVHGAIMHASTALPGRRAATLGGLTAALRRAARDPRALGVLLYVDSPGGSALASDLIHRELVQLRAKKPVVAFMGDVAASGGYYVAAPCQRIVAQPTTLTGSIGVVSARVLVGTLARRLGVHPQVVRSAPHADLHSPFRPLAPDERALVAAEIDEVYTSFVQVVASGRGRSVADVEQLAGGRVWSGRDALQAGLVDELGGFEQALSALRALAPKLQSFAPGELPLRVVAGGPNLPPTGTPSPNAANALGALGGDLSELWALCQGGEGVLAYALIPKIR
jgi:protease-4